MDASKDLCEVRTIQLVALSLQSFTYYPHRTVYDNLDIGIILLTKIVEIIFDILLFKENNLMGMLSYKNSMELIEQA
jgi:hypothetical protein